MTNEIWCVTQYDDSNFNYTPMFFSSQFDAVDYMLKDINEYIDGELPFDIRADRYTATLETNDFAFDEGFYPMPEMKQMWFRYDKQTDRAYEIEPPVYNKIYKYAF